MHLNLSRKLLNKKTISYSNTEQLEKSLEHLKQFISYKPIYKLYKSYKEKSDEIIKQFFKSYEIPAKIHYKVYNKNDNLITNSYNNAEVSRSKYNFGDFILRPLTLDELDYEVFYVNHNYRLESIDDDGVSIEIDKSYGKYIKNMEKKLKNVIEPLITKIGHIYVRHDDKLIKRLFNSVFPSFYSFVIYKILDPTSINMKYTFMLRIKKYNYASDFPLIYSDGKFHLKHKNITYKKVLNLFEQQKLMTQSGAKYKYVRLRKIAFNNEKLRNIIENTLNNEPKLQLEMYGNGFNYNIFAPPGASNTFIGFYNEDEHKILKLSKYLQKNSTQKIIYYNKNYVKQ